MHSRLFWSMVAFRAAYLFLIIVAVIEGSWDTVTTHVPLFCATLIVPYLARMRKHLYLLDVYIVGVLALSMTISYLPGLALTYGSPLGIDKLFHFLGGVGAAWGTLLLFPKERGWRLGLLAAIGALAIGAGWEIFEWVLSLLPAPYHVWHSGLADAMMDLIADTLGGCILGLLCWRTKLLKLDG